MSEIRRFIILDDHPAMLEGLKTILEKEGDFICAGTAGTVEDGRALIRSARYDLMVTDIRFPDGSGFDLAGAAKQHDPHSIILFMSMYVTFDYILKAFQSGARGFLSKDSAGSTLREGARQLIKGHHFLDPAALREVMETITRSRSSSFIGADEGYHLLTGREREIFLGIARKRNSRELARELGISPKTVLNHRQNILYKLDLESDLDLIAYAVQLGFVSHDGV